MTATEFNRIKTAINACAHCVVNDAEFVHRSNVLAIIGSFVDGAKFDGRTVTVPVEDKKA